MKNDSNPPISSGSIKPVSFVFFPSSVSVWMMDMTCILSSYTLSGIGECTHRYANQVQNTSAPHAAIVHHNACLPTPHDIPPSASCCHKGWRFDFSATDFGTSEAFKAEGAACDKSDAIVVEQKIDNLPLYGQPPEYPYTERWPRVA